MHRFLRVVAYVFQAALGLIVLGLAAVAPTAVASQTPTADLGARPADRSPTSTHSQGPALP